MCKNPFSKLLFRPPAEKYRQKGKKAKIAGQALLRQKESSRAGDKIKIQYTPADGESRRKQSGKAEHYRTPVIYAPAAWRAAQRVLSRSRFVANFPRQRASRGAEGASPLTLLTLSVHLVLIPEILFCFSRGDYNNCASLLLARARLHN